MDAIASIAALGGIAAGLAAVFLACAWLRSRSAAAHRAARLWGGAASPNDGGGHRAAIAEIANFRAIRRRIGYRSANAIMETLAVRLMAAGPYRVARVGRTAIEFTYQARDDADASDKLCAARAALEGTVEVDGFAFDPEPVIGSSAAAGGLAAEELFELADLAMEDAYRQPSRVAIANENAIAAATSETAGVLAELAKAIRHDALQLHYLPKLNLDTGRIVGAEALCRWTHPVHGEVAPTVFIALAEDTGLIDELTLWTLDRAVADQRRLLAEGVDISLEVNLSGRLISNAAFCQIVAERIAGSQGPIGLEITETATIEAPEQALVNLQSLAAAGIRIAIDDFGSGLSSLSYLRNLPAHELKIDQCFIRNLTSSNRDPLLVRSAIEIARALEMEVTAEGVEDELALSLLTVMRCNYVQGFHISPPLPLEELIAYLAKTAEHLANPYQADRQDVSRSVQSA